MFSALLLGIGLLVAAPPEGLSRDGDRADYEAVRDKLGRDPEAHVRLALWCERPGLEAERIKHLSLAVLHDPKHVTARGLLGLVAFRGHWEHPEAVSAEVQSDEELTAKLAEYNGRRARTADTADAQWKLALWCEEVGLKPEAQAHLDTVTRLDPSREAAWQHLGFKKHGGRWVTEAQLAAEKAETEAQKKADQHWTSLLTRWRAEWQEKGKKKDEAEDALAGVDDPRAVPAVWKVFAVGDAAHQAKAVQVLGQIDAAGASRALAMLAISGRSAEVRRAARETLIFRDAREFVDLLIALIRDPIKYEVRPVRGPALPGELFVEGKRYDVRRVYGLTDNQAQALRNRIPSRIFDPSVPFDPFGAQNLWMALGPGGAMAPVATMPTTRALAARPQDALSTLLGFTGPATAWTAGRTEADAAVIRANEEAARRDMQIAQALIAARQVVNVSQQQLDNDIRAIEATNAVIRQANTKVFPVLEDVTGQSLGESSEAWQRWWTDQRGYAYKSSTPEYKPTYTDFVPNPVAPISVRHSCFAVGTLARTLGGPRPIESIRIGDQILSQDPKTGRLSFVPVVAVFHNEPAPTLRINLGGETIVATPIHRFWKAGEGWAMARDLKSGVAVRGLGGLTSVTSVEADRVQPVFNLQVAEGGSFFVGRQGTLVHDNSLVQPVPKPFDAAPHLAAITDPAVGRDWAQRQPKRILATDEHG